MQQELSLLGRAALDLARKGYSVFPVTPSQKSPPLVQWRPLQERVASETEIFEWWTEHPNANIGVVCGKISGITVIDIDPKHGGQETFDTHLKDVLPRTRTHKTPSGGKHYLFRYNADLLQSQNKANHRGIDIRNDGGYIIAPPSSVNDVSYSVIDDSEPVELYAVPDIFQKANVPIAIVPNTETWVTEALENGVEESRRNELAAKLAGYYHKHGIPKDIILATLTPYAERCTPQMDLEELRRTIDSVTRYERASRGLQEPPKFEQDGEEFVFTFEAPQITFRIFDVRKTRFGFESLVSVTTNRVLENTNVWGPRNWILNSTTGTRDLIKVLEKRIPDLDWTSMVDTTARLMVELHRKGEPSITMNEVADQNVVDLYDLWPFVASNHINMLIGDGETGKSILADAICVSLAASLPVIGFNPPERFRRPLYLDWETDAAIHKMRMKGIMKDRNISESHLEDISYMRMELPLQEDMARIKAEMSKKGIGFIVIDSVAMAVAGDLDNQTARDFSRCLRSLNTTVLAIAHVPKSEIDKVAHGPMGGVTFRNMSRNGWTVVKTQEEGKPGFALGLHHTKHNNDQKHSARGLSLQFEDDRISIDPITMEQEPDLAKTVPLKTRVVGHMRSYGGKTEEQLADALDVDRKEIANILSRDNGRNFARSNQEPYYWQVRHTG